MKGEQLIMNLLRVKEQYKYKPCYTGEVNIPNMIDDVVAEINRLTSNSVHDKHYIELGKAVESAYNKGAFLIYDVVEDYQQNIISYNSDSDLDDLLEWNACLTPSNLR
jgi:hypothetical protein